LQSLKDRDIQTERIGQSGQTLVQDLEVTIMATAEQVKALVKSHAEGDDTRFFFAEVDALGGERARANDVGEIRRVLNSFLQISGAG
jgi:hypothetical protein